MKIVLISHLSIHTISEKTSGVSCWYAGFDKVENTRIGLLINVGGQSIYMDSESEREETSFGEGKG